MSIAPLTDGNALVVARNILGLQQAAFAVALGVSVATLRRHEHSHDLDPTIALAAECLLWRRKPEKKGYQRLTPEEWTQRREERLKAEEALVGTRVRQKLIYKAELERQKAVLQRNQQRVYQRQRIAAIYLNLCGAAARGDTRAYHEILASSRIKDANFIDIFLDAAALALPATNDPVVTLPEEQL